MNSIVLVIHLILAIALVGAVLLQKSEGGALGMGGGGGGGGGMGGFMTGRGAADLLTRTTAILAACFMATSMILAILAADTRTQGSILDKPQAAPSAPVKPTGPSVPLAY
ncbi:MAG TPA: preprotein translocase subunit SecG [Rhodospirillales bacterium]|jgi:preprotein translocase subunit SecG|nr:preprotein translocase subunit SecG [Rhodospirillales bacterium]